MNRQTIETIIHLIGTLCLAIGGFLITPALGFFIAGIALLTGSDLLAIDISRILNKDNGNDK